MPRGCERPVTHRIKVLADGRQVVMAVVERTQVREGQEPETAMPMRAWGKAG